VLYKGSRMAVLGCRGAHYKVSRGNFIGCREFRLQSRYPVSGIAFLSGFRVSGFCPLPSTWPQPQTACTWNELLKRAHVIQCAAKPVYRTKLVLGVEAGTDAFG